MRIAIVGAGGVGGYFGGLLAHAGQDVIFIARGAHLTALRERGLQVHSGHGDFSVAPVDATDDFHEVGPVDLALVCVKNFHLDAAIPAMPPLVGDQTTVLPLLNGVEAADRLAAALGREHVLPGLCSIVSFVAEPGVIQQMSAFRHVVFGEWDGRPTPRAQAIFDALHATGVEVELAADVRKAMWTKFLFITAYSGVASVVRLPAGGLHACAETMSTLREAMAEIEAVARAHAVQLDSDVVEKTMAFVQNLAPEATASMQRDVEAGRQFELEALTGAVVRFGARAGVPTPVNQCLYALLRPHLLAL